MLHIFNHNPKVLAEKHIDEKLTIRLLSVETGVSAYHVLVK